MDFSRLNGSKKLSVKDKMLNVFEHLERNCEDDIMSLEPKDRMRLMIDLAKLLMPKSDVDAKDEKTGRAGNSEGIKEYFGVKIDLKNNEAM